MPEKTSLLIIALSLTVVSLITIEKTGRYMFHRSISLPAKRLPRRMIFRGACAAFRVIKLLPG